MAKFSEIKDQSKAELLTQVRDLSKKIYELDCELALTRKLEKPHLRKLARHDRARALTALAQQAKG